MASNNFHSVIVQKGRSLPGIHGIRGFTALSIFLFHLKHLTEMEIPGAFQFIARDFCYGVHLFYVMSAFILMYSTEQTMERSSWIKEFFTKRFFRIAPLFYFIIAFELLRQAVFHGGTVSILKILINISFIFGLVPSEGFVMASWSIGVEVIFYILFPFLLLIVRTNRSALILLFITLIISVSSRYFLHEQYLKMTQLPQYDWWGYFSFPPNLFFFSIGIFSFKIKSQFSKDTFVSRFIIPIIAILIIGGLLLTEIDKPLRNNSERIDLIIWAIGFGALCIWQSIKPCFLIANNFFEFIGERSYSIYLLNPIIILFLKDYILRIYTFLTPYMHTYAFFICAIIVFGFLLVFSEITYRFIEVPGIKLGRSLIKRI